MYRTTSSQYRPCNDPEQVYLPEVISALTFALDLTEGAAPGHALRTCVLGMRLAQALGLPDGQMTPLFYALQLKDVGCSNNAARMAQLVGGDDLSAKRVARLTDWTRPWRADARAIGSLWPHVLPDAPPWQRAARMLRLAMCQPQNNREMIDLRCGRGSAIVRKLMTTDLAAAAIFHLDEHWNGEGLPTGLRGQQIPVLSRIISVAQSLDAFAAVEGTAGALKRLASRRGTWFDPELVKLAEHLHRSGALWQQCHPQEQVDVTHAAVVATAPEAPTPLGADKLDAICGAFADVVDAKSPFTYRHSMGVAEGAHRIGQELGLPPNRLKLLHRAALLHDLGKLRVPNTILDKAGKLNEHEWNLVAEHPGLTRTILERVPSFAELALIAGEHHERLDGSGYPMRLCGDDLSLESRVIAVADTFAAMVEVRPYRAGMQVEKALMELDRMAPWQLDVDCVHALQAACEHWEPLAASQPREPGESFMCAPPAHRQPPHESDSLHA